MIFNFNFSETSFWLNFQSFAIYIVLLWYSMSLYNTIYNVNNVKYRHNILPLYINGYIVYSKKKYRELNLKLFIGILLLSLTYVIASDFFGYQRIIEDYDMIHLDSNYGENIYVYIASFVDKNYLLFRFVVWGGALLGIAITYIRLSRTPNLCLIFLFLGFINTFSYARASLAMSIFFLGFSFICKPIERYRLLSYSLGVLAMISSVFFHYSLFVLLPLSVFTLNSVYKVTKGSISLILIIMIIFILFFLNNFFVGFISGNFNGMDYLDNKIQGYAEKEVILGNWKGILQSYVEFAKYYISFFLILRVVLFSRRKENAFNAYTYKLFKLSSGIIVLATIFYFLDLNNKVFFYRILYMSFIPLTILLSELYEKRYLKRKVVNYLIAFFLFHELWLYAFSLYSKY